MADRLHRGANTIGATGWAPTADPILEFTSKIAQTRLLKHGRSAGQLVQQPGYLVEFGLTPSARSKVHAAPDDDKKADPLKEFFG